MSENSYRPHNFRNFTCSWLLLEKFLILVINLFGMPEPWDVHLLDKFNLEWLKWSHVDRRCVFTTFFRSGVGSFCVHNGFVLISFRKGVSGFVCWSGGTKKEECWHDEFAVCLLFIYVGGNDWDELINVSFFK